MALPRDNDAKPVHPPSDERSQTTGCDDGKIDDAVLALLWLTLHDGCRAWKSVDWDAMKRLHAEGMIDDPRGKAKSVVLTPEGLARSERLFQERFAREP